MISIFNFHLNKYVYIKKSVRGFTLVELLVSLALFTSVITIATGALFSAQAINSKLEQTQVILDGVSLSLETMSREIRYGSAFYCDSNIPNPIPSLRKNCSYGSTADGGGVLIFRPVINLTGSVDYSSDRVAYYLLDGVIYKDEYKEGNISNKKTSQITTPDAKIDSLTFFVTGADSFQVAADFNQPLITIVASGVTVPSKPGVTAEHFSLQTSVSSRRFDN